MRVPTAPAVPTVPAAPAVLITALVAVLIAGTAGCSSRPAPAFTPGDLRAGASGGSAAPGSGGTSGNPGGRGNPEGPGDPASTASPAAAAPGTETVQAAPGVRVAVEAPAAADPDTAGMVAVVRDYFAESLRAIAGGGEDDAYLGRLEMDGSRQGYDWVHSFVDEGRSVRGTARLYGFVVRAVDGPGAELGLCVDLSGMRVLDARTGRARRPESWMRRPYFQVVAVRRYDDGTRRIRRLLYSLPPGDSAEGCQR
ncbi:hypothetical protein [Planomonospora alba]|uniref:hypothetical protein n=1 Tax=Planomonospora alba TaxID=161354 RepID=UPI0031E6DEB7